MTVRITYLGHAGFCMEDDATVIVMDPWLSRNGAFDSAWFPYPPNLHMADAVRERLSDTSRDRYVYISHEHRDHFDLEFLQSLPDRSFTLVAPHFRRATLLEKLRGYRCRRIAALLDRERVAIAGGWMQLYLDDSELNRDSALIVRMRGKTFFNMNDCKLFDRLDEVREDGGTIDAFACQFSGATWHPTCYAYEESRYAAISKRKVFAKFEAVARAIEKLEPAMYVPSAGPACFLDPQLYHLNFEECNIFPQQEKVARYLSRRLRRMQVEVARIGPGGIIDLTDEPKVASVGAVVDEGAREGVVRSYAAERQGLFASRRVSSRQDAVWTLARLRAEFSRKLEHLSLADRVDVPLYFRLSESQDLGVKVDFQRRTAIVTDEPCESEFYELVAPAWQVQRALDGALTWEEFSLTFRVKIRRNPDVYQPVLHAFLLLDAEDLTQWCAMIEAIESKQERITVTCEGREYSILRYCPHQGGDLTQGWMEDGCLVCPRHHWRFDVRHGGACTTNGSSVRAVLLGESPKKVNVGW
jgi:UDP-MurNAc hydroxylase